MPKYHPSAGMSGPSRYLEPTRACRHCEYWLEWTAGGSHAVCGRSGETTVIGQPENGCAFWQRGDPGVDDDLGDPPTEPVWGPY